MESIDYDNADKYNGIILSKAIEDEDLESMQRIWDILRIKKIRLQSHGLFELSRAIATKKVHVIEWVYKKLQEDNYYVSLYTTELIRTSTLTHDLTIVKYVITLLMPTSIDSITCKTAIEYDNVSIFSYLCTLVKITPDIFTNFLSVALHSNAIGIIQFIWKNYRSEISIRVYDILYAANIANLDITRFIWSITSVSDRIKHLAFYVNLENDNLTKCKWILSTLSSSSRETFKTYAAYDDYRKKMIPLENTLIEFALCVHYKYPMYDPNIITIINEYF